MANSSVRYLVDNTKHLSAKISADVKLWFHNNQGECLLELTSHKPYSKNMLQHDSVLGREIFPNFETV